MSQEEAKTADAATLKTAQERAAADAALVRPDNTTADTQAGTPDPHPQATGRSE
ncbi:MAG: hypothetical protein M1120_02105 [Patescibacteria group bacterium]|nr:hypothetical protein [Patescibacteria group bacterium]